MTKKKRGHPDIEEVLARPWCYYCERDFDDLKILINHQKAKHFKCDKCGRRLNTAGGLNVHMNQVHKETLASIENALPNRAGLDVEIFGMEGIPEDVVQQHNQRVLTQFHQNEAERRAATGNPAPGTANNNGQKKPKFESPADLKKRLAEHKAAKLAAEQNGGGSSGASTPIANQQTAASTQQMTSAQPANYAAGYAQPYAPPPSASTFGAPQSYSQSPVYGIPPPSFPGSPPPIQPGYGQPSYQNIYAQPSQPGGPPPPAGVHPYGAPGSFPPPPFPGQQAFPGSPFQSQPPQNGFAGPGYPSASPTPQLPHHTRTESPQANLPPRLGSNAMPGAPGLPQRPAVSAPHVNAAQFQQMHQGQIPPQHNIGQLPTGHTMPAGGQDPSGITSPVPQSQPQVPGQTAGASSLDDLISSASKQADDNTARAQTATPKPTSNVAKEDAGDDKTAKKEKAAKPTRMIYSDNELSPEEKMAALPKYSFTPLQKAIHV